MDSKSSVFKSPIQLNLLAKQMAIGAGIALLLISIFLLGVDDPNPLWGRFWMVRPLVIVPLAGAAGGAFFYFANYVRIQQNWNKFLIYFGSLLAFIFIVWVGIVVGLDGTLWN